MVGLVQNFRICRTITPIRGGALTQLSYNRTLPEVSYGVESRCIGRKEQDPIRVPFSNESVIRS